MNATEIIQLLPDKLLSDLAIETRVNKYSKKLQGETIFKLLLYCVLSYKDNSLRRMECAYESIAFRLLNSQIAGKIKFKVTIYNSTQKLVFTQMLTLNPM
ncbi:MAG: hypothetical protein U0T07_10405 [Chitinophagales bacterium]